MAPAPELKNIEAILALERQTLGNRRGIDRISDAISSVASRPIFILVHLGWFATWIAFNLGVSRPFDPFPFSLLTLIVAMEAIVLTGFVLMAQSRMTQQADRRAHLDLQINLLGEQELTAILRLQCLMAQQLGIDVHEWDPSLGHMLSQTDVRALAGRLDQGLAEMEAPRDGA